MKSKSNERKENEISILSEICNMKTESGEEENENESG